MQKDKKASGKHWYRNAVINDESNNNSYDNVSSHDSLNNYYNAVRNGNSTTTKVSSYHCILHLMSLQSAV
ncbi:Hypothetical predicted protein [Octopus vulgaris]|uniref:Uncharacterized protein n=1 Tax=Octopus vulgaris TaxID=6645 RepID=A0AA36B9S0_OCTVU|nr:Hypothetical predicted protein [Octopus vulgaris]